MKLATILTLAGVDTLGVLDAEVDIPIITGAPQAQGDVAWFPRPNRAPATTPIPADGLCVVRAESSGGNTHTLHSWDGAPSLFDPSTDGGPNGITLGVLTVPAGSSAYLVHSEEHGANGIGPGTYVVCGQREQADIIRRVAD